MDDHTLASDTMLMKISNLRVGFDTQQGPVTIVDGVSIEIQAGEIVAIVGESGCGKSVTALSLTRLTGSNSNILSGEVIFQGQDLARLPIEQLRSIRGKDISYIFQEPMTSLNPVYTVGEQIMEPLMLHMNMSRAQARLEAVRLLDLVNIPSPHLRVTEYPHQLSGGMRQRVMIAMALACRPKLLIADEPTTALDVTVQAQILELLQGLQREFGMAILLITHDMGVVSEFSDKVVVMYAGRIAETGKTEEIFQDPRHPYTKALLHSIPPIDYELDRLPTLPGTVPSPTNMPAGCRFHDRCVDARPECKLNLVDPLMLSPSHAVACIKDFGYQVPRELRT